MSLGAVLQVASSLGRGQRIDFSMPRISDWRIEAYSKGTAGIDVADWLSLGAGAVAPINVNVGGGKVEMTLYKPSANLRFKISGWGLEVGVGAGWNVIPGFSASGGLAQQLARKVANGAIAKGQDEAAGALSGAAGLPNGGIGTLLAGPTAPSVMAPAELDGCITLVGCALEFAANGLGGAIAIFAPQPVTSVVDLVFARAIGLVGDVHFTLGKVEAGVNYASFYCKVDKASMPEGGYQGLCVGT